MSHLDTLFPLPSPVPAPSGPSPNPGPTQESAAELVRLLKENHTRFHCFFNESRFHNHLSHHLFAAYALGAPPSLLRAAFDEHASYQRPIGTSPSPIDSKNWKDHLGKPEYYPAYLEFFTGHVLKDGIAPVLQTYIFSAEANWGIGKSDSEDTSSPLMLNRFVSGLLHPLIHFGHSVEFGILGHAAEGLAITAVHNPATSALLPRDFFPDEPDVSLASLSISTEPSSQAPENTSRRGVHSFTLVSRMLADPRLAAGQGSEESSQQKFDDTMKNRGELIRKYCSEWVVDGDAQAKIEELSWLVSLIFGVGGWRDGKDFRADFFLMHLVTSCIFLPSIVAHLPPLYQDQLLRAFLSVVLGYWVSRGRPSLPIKSFYEKVTPTPHSPLPDPKPSQDALDRGNSNPNPWLPILESTLVHPNEHLLKLQRSLAHFAASYGNKGAGRWTGTELEGAELLDGTLFLRVAGQAMDRLGWVREGQKKGEWYFNGFWNWDD